ncbi:sensor histidine kinase [Dictyobacter aurantiacus]|uniref:histidine kinase n=1 Tax=Dictyobacter aurantiacus TaxID=1936993 RepID=A0A401ZAN0_9CHLR|nr:HAMP domain-containing sensor histidine kinase [Dictyobacter aurantiacus]GCE03941.1 hypothetical protein KDAU_12700 [Dictyobacter aurantiacus]
MRLAHGNIYTDKRGRRYRRISLEQRSQLRKDYMSNVPKWRHPLIGYLVAIPATVIVSLCTIYVTKMFGQFFFPSTFSIIVIVVAALFWGAGPAIWSILLNAAVLYYIFILPLSSYDYSNWRDALQLLPFIGSGLVIALITAQRERARFQAMATELELQSYAQELEETNRRLEDANQMKDRFLSIASHELKTPVTTIRGQAQLMLRRISRHKDLEHMDGVATTLERINDQTGRLTTLIDELLDVSSIRTGKAALNRRLCNVTALCREVVEDQRLLTERMVLLDAPPEPVTLKLDVDRFSQVMTNLVSNAIKYSPDDTPVEVSIKPGARCVLFSVRDHGRGIAKDQQERVFETFYRTPDAQTSSKRGLGLGLAITKDIVERHNGRIWCESELKKGSTFYVELPVSPSP